MSPSLNSSVVRKKDSVITPQRVTSYVRQRYNPLVNLKPDTLLRMQDQFDAGHLREFSLVMERIKEVDDNLKNVAGKREKAPGVRGYEVLTVETDDTERAERHKDCLVHFYDNLSATNAIDSNERGGMGVLLRQMMYATGFKYATHEIIWKPSPKGITAEFRYTPLWFFEHTTDSLRFLESDGAMYGVDLEPGAWMVTTGDMLMRACSIAYMFKHLPLRDWLVYSGHHGIPGRAGKTSAAPGSDEWKAMEAAVRDFANDFAAVMSKDDTIETIDLSSQGELPFPKLIDRMDRMMASLWRGADLSTLSKAEGLGASLQQEETEILEAADAMMLSEALHEYVDPYVIAYHLGDEEPLAYIQIKTATREDVEQELKVDQGLHRMGFPISLKSLSQRYNRPLPDDEDELLPPPRRALDAPRNVTPAANAKIDLTESPIEVIGKILSVGRIDVAEAERADMKPLADAVLDLIAQIERENMSDAELINVIREFQTITLPVVLLNMGKDPSSATEIGDILVASFFNGMEHESAQLITEASLV